MKSREDIHSAVETRYAEIARRGSSCCCTGTCGQIGYSAEELSQLPADAVMGLGCGNPVKLADARVQVPPDGHHIEVGTEP